MERQERVSLACSKLKDKGNIGKHYDSFALGQSDKRSRMAAGETVKTKKYRQVIAAFAATIGAFALGTGLAWTSPALPHLADCTNCTLPVSFTAQQGSWIASLFPVGAMIASQAVGLLMPRIGRKWTLIGLSIPFLAGWICLLITDPLQTTSPWLFYVGRILTGIGGGGFALAPPIYISETAETSIRGSLSSIMQFMVTIGIAFINGLGIQDAVSWPIITGICIIFPVLSAAAMMVMPESPYYLVTKGKNTEARKALVWLRGNVPMVDAELKEMQATHMEQDRIGSVGIVQLFKHQVYLRPLIIVVLLMFFQQFSGINAVLFYLQAIFIKTGTDIDPGLSAFLVALVQVLTTGLAVLIVEKFGRRILLIFSIFIMCISILALGIYFYLDENKWCAEDNSNMTTTMPTPLGDHSDLCTHGGTIDPETVKSLGWLPLVSLTIYIFAFAIGMGPLPWTINAEMFPLEAKSTSSSTATIVNWTCAFFVSKFQSNITDGIGASGAYFLFASICALGTVFILFFLPETKGKTSEDMRAYFLDKSHDPSKSIEAAGFENSAYQS